MSRATGHAYSGREEQAKFFDVLKQSLNKRADLAEMVADTEPTMIALTDMAHGYYYEMVNYVHGEPVTRIYKKGPNLKAIELRLALGNYDTKANADAALSAVRAVSGLVQQNLMVEQSVQSKAIAAKTVRETRAMDLSYATEDQFTKMAISLGASLLNFIQATPVDEFPRSEIAKQKWLERLTKRINDLTSDLLKMDGDGDDEDE
jgi:hypothetical protein